MKDHIGGPQQPELTEDQVLRGCSWSPIWLDLTDARSFQDVLKQIQSYESQRDAKLAA